MKVFIGVDCGATNLRVGIFSEEGELVAYSKTASPLKDHPDHLAEVVHGQLDILIPEKRFYPKAIGVGIPGPLDLKNGWILPSSNLGNKEPISIRDQFMNDIPAPLFLDRDTNLALLGEVWKGAAVGVKDAVMLTLGTGVGGAIMVDGKLEHGVSGKAGEIGHMLFSFGGLSARSPVRHPRFAAGAQRGTPLAATPRVASKNLPVCGLGHQGCFEALMNSAKGLEEMAEVLGYGLANIVDIFNPQKIIIGGGKIGYILPTTKHRDLLSLSADIMKKVGIKSVASEVEITYAKLDEVSGVYGGAKLAMESVKAGR